MTSSHEGALAGVRVVDLSRVYAGRSARRRSPTTARTSSRSNRRKATKRATRCRAASPATTGANRNKRNLALDLSHPDGRDVLFRLLDTADVLIDNFKQGTLERWGIGYEDCLRERFPRLVHCSISGYGTDGPLARFPATTPSRRVSPASCRSTASRAACR